MSTVDFQMLLILKRGLMALGEQKSKLSYQSIKIGVGIWKWKLSQPNNLVILTKA